VAQEAKDGWQAATKYFWGYYDTAKFTKRLVRDRNLDLVPTNLHIG